MAWPSVAPAGAIAHCGAWERDGYKSIQVNVEGRGCNIVGDAANEPSIAIDPTDPRKIVVGWRQFNSVSSDFREPGWAYSHDGGHTWVFRGSLDPGVFGSDPVLAAGPRGETYYLSINFDEMRLFRSLDGGLTWTPNQVVPYFYDKPWMTVDTTGGIGHGNVYITRGGGAFLRSIDRAQTFQVVTSGFRGSTVSVGPEGTVYAASGYARVSFMKSTTVQDPAAKPVFDGASLQVAGDGSNYYLVPPNPYGLGGQAWIATDHSPSVTRGNIYVLTLAITDPLPGDPADLVFIRSTDGGGTWSRPVVINDDPLSPTSWQWFNTLSVAPDGRLDVVWNDTRNSGAVNLSELYYSFSTDGGLTWSLNSPASPVFDSWVGWPSGSEKLGDYYHMVSDNLGVNVAYAATFNGEQDIYFLRIGPWDCNGNQIDDALDISELRSRDCNTNAVPDECEYRADANGDGLTTLADFTTFQKNLTGPGVPIPADCTQLLDSDHDGDIDLHDFYLMQHVFVAP